MNSCFCAYLTYIHSMSIDSKKYLRSDTVQEHVARTTPIFTLQKRLDLASKQPRISADYKLDHLDRIDPHRQKMLRGVEETPHRSGVSLSTASWSLGVNGCSGMQLPRRRRFDFLQYSGKVSLRFDGVRWWTRSRHNFRNHENAWALGHGVNQ